jgi:hypothetical protein
MSINLWNENELYFHHEFINDQSFPIEKKNKLEKHFGSYFIKGDYTVYQEKCNLINEIVEDDFFKNRAAFLRILYNIPPMKVEELLQFHFDNYNGEKIRFLNYVYRELKGSKTNRGGKEIPPFIQKVIAMDWSRSKIEEIESAEKGQASIMKHENQLSLITEISDIKLEAFLSDENLIEIIYQRINEIIQCLNANAPLSVIFLCGSILEGILFTIAKENPQKFNSSKSSPKKDEKVKEIGQWTLNDFIVVSSDLGLLSDDITKHSHSLKDFRNYIHPREQAKSKFNPNIDTAKIEWQVLKTAITQLEKNYKTLS